ncbi:MAG: DUF1800 domain-containing protein [Dokdonella sp.]
MATASLPASTLSRRDLFTGGGLKSTPAAAMHSPTSAKRHCVDAPDQQPEPDYATPPNVARWLSKASYGYSAAAQTEFNGLTGGNDDARWTTWVNQQLAPASISDVDCSNRITAAGYTTLGKTLQQLWHDHMVVDPPYFTRLLPTAETEAATLIRAVYSRRQLFERATNFWHDHFSVLGWEYDIAPIFASYDRDVIRPNVFGNFRVMLEAVAKSTAMQLYLDQYASRGAAFNENYARELIELHTLGVANYYGPTDPFQVPCLVPLETNVHCDGTMPAGYVDNDVYEAAASLTGWSLKNGYWQYPNDDDGSFVYRPEWHDRRNKIFIGHYIPGNQPSLQDGRDVFDRLCAHPGTARHIATKMCRRFVGDEPSSALIDSVAGVFRAQISAPDQLAQMLRTILLSTEFKTSWGGGMRRPYEMMVSAMRGLGTQFTPQPDNTNSWTTTERLTNYLGQAGHRSFNWTPPNGYPDRQSAWASTGALAMSMKLLAWLPEMEVVSDATPQVFAADIVAQTQAQFPLAARTAGAIVGWWCDRLFGHRPEPAYGVVTSFLQQNATASEVIDLTTDDWHSSNLKTHYTQRRLRTAVGMLLMSPDYFRR